MEEYKEQIKNLFTNFPVQFIMYHPGSGGEFLTSLITKYSDKFNHIPAIRLPSNRWAFNAKRLFQEFCQEAQDITRDPLTFDQLVDKTISSLLEKNVNLQDEINNAYEIVTSHDKINLFRLHHSFDSLFTKENTYILKLNNRWLTYSLNLSFVKIHQQRLTKFSNEFNIEIQRRRQNKIGIETNLENLENFLKTSHIQSVTYSMIAISNLPKKQIGKLDMSKFLKLTSAEIFKEYSKAYLPYPGIGISANLLSNLEDHYKDFPVIEYDNIFTKGYLEEMFSIQSDEFHKELINWHNENLELMRKYNIPCD